MADQQSAYSNMVEYAKRNFKTFDEEAPNAVDCLIFSWLVYLNIHEEPSNSVFPQGMPLRELLKAEYFEEMLDKVWTPEETMSLIIACAASPRFRNVRMKYYRHELIEDINLQFAAIVFSVTDTLHIVMYRGTDWSIVGWKEDILLALEDPIPAQEKGTEYLNEIGSLCEGDFIVAGHSKGGNLAVYSAAHCNQEIQDRIINVYSFDGPGFLTSTLEYPGFPRILDRVVKYVPQASYFGMLFQSEVNIQVIYSNGFSVMQHNPLSWKVEGHVLCPEEKRKVVSSFINTRLNRWLGSLTEDQKLLFIQVIFDIFDDLEVESIDEITGNLTKYIPEVLKSLAKMDKERRKMIQYALHLTLLGKKDEETAAEENLETPPGEEPADSYQDFVGVDDYEAACALYVF